MPRFGYFLSCEEFGPAELVRQAKLAEEAGFDGCGSPTTTIRGTPSRGRVGSCGR